MTFKRRDDATALADLHQSGCLKARFPRAAGGWAEAIAVNSSGGVAGGDALHIAANVGDGARAVVTAQAAERFYRASDGSGPAIVRGAAYLGAGASLDWLPQEAILFDGLALDRELRVEMAADATFVCVESLLFGRAAMGEQVRRGTLRDRVTIRRDGRLLFHDTIRLRGDMAADLDRAAIGGGARALATVLYVAPDAAGRLDAVRGAGVAASCWNGMLIGRILAPDGQMLRRDVIAVLSALRDGRTLPRSWNL